MRVPLTLLLLLILLPLGPGALRADEYEDPLHENDLALLERVGAIVPPPGTAAAFLEAFPQGAEEVRDLGFEATWRRFELYGESVGISIDVISYRDRTACVRIHAPEITEGWRQDVERLWGVAVTLEDEILEYRHAVPEVQKAFDEAIARALGRPQLESIGPANRKAVETLTDPLADLTYGTACYESGSPPPGREPADTLRLTGAMNALDHVLRGPNPEGRIYAAQALLILEGEGEVLSADRQAALERVLALDLPIRCCGGSHFRDERASELFGKDFVRRRIALHILERLHTGEEFKDVGRIWVYWDMTWTRRTDGGGPGSGRDGFWRRGVLPWDLWVRLERVFGMGEGFLVPVGAPVYVHHLEDTLTKPPPGIQALLDHLDRKRPAPKEGSPPR